MAKTNSRHSNQVRIIGGECRGRKLTFPAAEGLRPTPDMVREKVFNWLGQDLTGQSVLDVFAGSGALGFEAASRRARRVLLLDNHRPTVHNLKKNAALMGLERAEVRQADGLAYLRDSHDRFDGVFLDPPFAWKNWPQLFAVLEGRLKNHAWVYMEAGDMPPLPDWLTVYREGKAGISRFALLHRTDRQAASM
ncbi:16S rRNA (guanine(966)-N(2))-methyltransferase RsmD [Neisseria leonii]|uniref:16S rRNA (guanine(966)-N(2))-methyltransferase RsmD n=1 Tax=Neisseria leonii TaxID=2995413 RepID=UPI00237A0A00|nr:16S rRNA (guanine(966)-N(2))-methyltransferase RsmD [Neisseria sp. 3986]MDD9325943.1 16S rRNA (guanine(966)-N(2))-methyltransferase RsmD [Neisseria sp. 3986]